MTGFLEVLVKGQELHQLPRRADLFKGRRLVDDPEPFPGCVPVGGVRAPFGHCVVVAGEKEGGGGALSIEEGVWQRPGREKLAENPGRKGVHEKFWR